MSEYLLNLGSAENKVDLKTRQQKKDLAIEALATKVEAADYFASVEEVPAIASPVSEYMRKKGGENEQISILEDQSISPEETVAQLRLNIESAGREKTAPEEDNALDAGLASTTSSLIVSPRQIKAEREANLSGLVGSLTSAAEEAKKIVYEPLKGSRTTFNSETGETETVSAEGDGWTPTGFVQAATDFAVGTGHNEVYNQILETLPEDFAVEGNRFTDFPGAVRSLGIYVQSLEPEEADKVTREFVAGLAERSGTVIGRDFAFYHNVQSVLANLEGSESGVTTALNGVIAAAELVGAGTGIAAILKKPIVVAAGSTAKYIGQGKAGAEALVRAATHRNGDKVLDAVNTNPEAVISTHVLPKAGGQEVDYAARYVDPDLVDPAKAAQEQALQLDIVQNQLSYAVPKHKINGSTIEPTDGGFKTITLLGGKDGNGFKTKASAQRLAKELNNNTYGEVADVVESQGRFFARYNTEVDYYKSDLPDFVNGESLNGGRWRGIFGRNAQFNGFLNKLAGESMNVSTIAERQSREIIKPYTTLPKKLQVKVQAVISEGDRVGKWFDDVELDSMGLRTAAEKDAYLAYQQLSRRSRAIQSARVREQLETQGYRGLKMGEETVIVRPMSNAAGAKRVLDQSGNEIPKPDSANFDFYKLPGRDATDGKVVDIVAVPKGQALDRLPAEIIKDVPGYLGRKYDKPVFIRATREIERNGVKETVTETIATAGSLKRGREAVEDMKAEGLGEGILKLEAHYGDEFISSDINLDLVAQIAKEGRLVGQKRNFNPIRDVDGDYAAPPVDDMIGKLVNNIGTDAGVGRFTDTMLDQLKRNYGKEWANLGKTPDMPTDAAGIAKWKEAKAYHSYLRNINGVSPVQSFRAVNEVRQTFAEMFYNMSLGANTSWGKSINKALGDELGGTRSLITDALKQATFQAYLLTNPLRQAVLQATMVPTYFGVHGGTKYLLSPKGFVKDLGEWSLNRTTGRKMSKELEEVARRFETSGVKGQVDQHIFDIGSAASSGIKAPGKFAQTMRVVKRYGMDIGVRADKRGAFLLSHQRFKTVNKRKPTSERDWKDIATFAEQMALNQNRSDTLLSQNGVAGLLTQFLSHQFKMTGRIIGLERDFDVAERIKMGAAGVASYGVAGYGFKGVWDAAKAATGIQPPPEADLVIEQGLLGASFNMVMNAAGADGEFATEDFAPANFLGNYPKAVANFIDGIADGGSVSLNPNFAAASLLGNAAGAVKWTGELLGMVFDDTISAETALTVAAPQYFTMFPITNNIFKAYMASRYGEVVDSKGRVIANTDSGWTGALRIMGIQTREEKDYYAGLTRYYGEWEGAGQDGIAGAIADEAKSQARNHAIIIGKAHDGDLTTAEARRIMKLHQDALRGLDPQAFGAYRNAYLRTLQKETRKYTPGYTMSEALVDLYERGAPRGEFESIEDQINWLRTQQFEGAGKLADQLEFGLFGRK